jgi:hypothetical protein
MKRFKIEFQSEERYIYSASVLAQSPEEALKLWKENPGDYDSNQDEMLSSDNLPDTAEVIGEWIEDKTMSGTSSLKRFAEPVTDQEKAPAESQADIETMEDQTEPDQNPEQTITISQADLALLTGRPKPMTVFGAYQHFLYYFDQALYEKEQPNGGLTRHFVEKLKGIRARHTDYNSLEVLVRWVQEMTQHNQEDLLNWILKHHSNKW